MKQVWKQGKVRNSGFDVNRFKRLNHPSFSKQRSVHGLIGDRNKQSTTNTWNQNVVSWWSHLWSYKDWEMCDNGKYKRIRYKGIDFDRCGVGNTMRRVRRERMGHIELKAPVSHIWPSKASPLVRTLWSEPSLTLEEVIYFAAYVVIDPKDTPWATPSWQNVNTVNACVNTDQVPFVAKIGCRSDQDLLKQKVDLEAEVLCEEKLKTATGQKRCEGCSSFGCLGCFTVWQQARMDVLQHPSVIPGLRPDGWSIGWWPFAASLTCLTSIVSDSPEQTV